MRKDGWKVGNFHATECKYMYTDLEEIKSCLLDAKTKYSEKGLMQNINEKMFWLWSSFSLKKYLCVVINDVVVYVCMSDWGSNNQWNWGL